jgi:hypothetical protein
MGCRFTIEKRSILMATFPIKEWNKVAEYQKGCKSEIPD